MNPAQIPSVASFFSSHSVWWFPPANRGSYWFILCEVLLVVFEICCILISVPCSASWTRQPMFETFETSAQSLWPGLLSKDCSNQRMCGLVWCWSNPSLHHRSPASFAEETFLKLCENREDKGSPRKVMLNADMSTMACLNITVQLEKYGKKAPVNYCKCIVLWVMWGIFRCQLNEFFRNVMPCINVSPSILWWLQYLQLDVSLLANWLNLSLIPSHCHGESSRTHWGKNSWLKPSRPLTRHAFGMRTGVWSGWSRWSMDPFDVNGTGTQSTDHGPFGKAIKILQLNEDWIALWMFTKNRHIYLYIIQLQYSIIYIYIYVHVYL